MRSWRSTLVRQRLRERAPRRTVSGIASRLTDGTVGWVQAALPSANDTGSDGRPSSVRFQFLPAIVVD